MSTAARPQKRQCKGNPEKPEKPDNAYTAEVIESMVDAFVNVTHLYVVDVFHHSHYCGTARADVLGVFRTRVEAMAALRAAMYTPAHKEDGSPWTNRGSRDYDKDYTMDEWLRKCYVGGFGDDANVGLNETEGDYYSWDSKFDASEDAARAANAQCKAALHAFHSGQDVTNLFDWGWQCVPWGWTEYSDEDEYLVGLNMGDDLELAEQCDKTLDTLDRLRMRRLSIT